MIFIKRPLPTYSGRSPLVVRHSLAVKSKSIADTARRTIFKPLRF